MLDANRNHVITVRLLRMLLVDHRLQDDWLLSPNSVQNLTILNQDGDYLGYIELGLEEQVNLDE